MTLRTFLTWVSLVLALCVGVVVGHMVTRGYMEPQLAAMEARATDAEAAALDAKQELAKNQVVIETWVGLASFYGDREHGRQTASGEVFDMNKYTAANWELPFGTLVLVENPKTGKVELVKITDRGPAKWTGRHIDLSKAAARTIGMEQDGVVPVMMHTIRKGE